MDIREFRAVAANVVIHPHSEDLYRQLLVDAFSLKRPMRLRGDRQALIAKITEKSELDAFQTAVVRGEIVTFLDIDLKAPWLDLERMEQADPQLTREVNIPDRLRASMARFEFIFDPITHTFVAQAESPIVGERIRIAKLSASMLAKFLERLFSEPEIFGKYGLAHVTPVPDMNSVESILRDQGLRKLTIIVKPPNPDDLEELAEEISERLKKQNAAVLRESLTALRGQSLQPDNDTKNLARVGAMNGRVEAVIAKDGGGTRSVSTQQKPAQFMSTFDVQTESTTTALERATCDAVVRIKEARTIIRTDIEPPAQPPPPAPLREA